MFEFRAADWPEKSFSDQSARRSSRGTLSPSYTRWFFPSISGLFLWSVSEKKRFMTKPRKSQAVTWAQENNTRRSIFTADLSKIYRKFISLIYAISTVLLVEREAWRVHNLLYFSTSETSHDVRIFVARATQLSRSSVGTIGQLHFS